MLRLHTVHKIGHCLYGNEVVDGHVLGFDLNGKRPLNELDHPNHFHGTEKAAAQEVIRWVNAQVAATIMNIVDNKVNDRVFQGS